MNAHVYIQRSMGLWQCIASQVDVALLAASSQHLSLSLRATNTGLLYVEVGCGTAPENFALCTCRYWPVQCVESYECYSFTRHAVHALIHACHAQMTAVDTV